jgi:hypothetical protein
MDVGERYLVLALRLAQVAPELVDSYSGAPELAAHVAAQAPLTPSALGAQARALRLAVAASAEDRARRRWLEAQLSALEVACCTLGGERMPYAQLVERCHGVRPAWAAERSFAAAHGRLAAALPGSAPLSQRFAAWREAQAVEPDRVLAALEALAVELRERTRVAFGLAPGERVELGLAAGRRWAGHARYHGGLRSSVTVNVDLPVPAYRLLELVAHEAYPGHHTEHAAKEAALVRGRGWLEHAVFLYPTPQALVAEGIAQVGLEALLAGPAERVAACVLRPLGIAYDVATARVVRSVKEALGHVRPNIAMLLDEGRSTDEVRAYARRWMLEPDDEVDRAVEAVARRAWRPYESCYPHGLALCRVFVRREPQGFQRLLAEPLTTADLVLRASSAEARR